MKKKSATQSAFFNLRVLIGLFIALAGVSVALLGFGGFTAQAQQKKSVASSMDPLVPAGFDCSKIRQLGIDRQENLRAGAIMIACGQAEGGSASPGSPGSKLMDKILTPLAYGGVDKDLVTGTETSPNITQSETYSMANPDNPLQVVVAYNDSRGRNATPINISAASVSTDGGSTFTRLTLASGQGPFGNTSGDPVVLFHKPTQTWFTVWLDGACTGGGLGGYKSTTPEVATSWTHFTCVHNGSSDDRESGWSDTNTASPFYGRMYVSWNDFAVGSGALEVTYSSDGGNTWHAPITVSNTATFIRDVQITGDLSGNGNMYIAGMDEGGGSFPHNDTNHIYKSTDGGNTWANTYTGAAFPGPGVTASGYFACMFSPAYWRHEGWGEPAAFNNVVSLVYAQHGTGADPGDVYYIRSTDGGVTFSAPFKLNSDSTTRPQWQPNLSVSPSGTLQATWYDARDSATCTQGNASVPCYRMYARRSNDNGATWLPDDTFSDVVSPLPGQPDGGIVAVYVGDYDYGSASAAKHVTSWADGRVAIPAGTSQQDAFTDRDLVGYSVTTSNPACGATVTTQLNDFVITLTDPVNTSTVQATDFTVNGTPANSVMFSNANATLTFHFNASPVTTQGVQTMHIAAGAFNRQSDNAPNLDFTCTFCYAVTPLAVTSTVPAVGGNFTPPAPGNYSYQVIFNQAVDPATVQDSDLTVSGNSGPSVTGHSVSGNTVTFMLHMNNGGALTASLGAGAVAANTCNGNAAFSGNYTVDGCPPSDHYVISQIGGSIVPGTVDTGNHIDDGITTVALPFSYALYDQTYSSVNLSSNGNAQFTTTDTNYINQCLPWTTHNYTILPYWDDQRTDSSGSGIFTSVSGTAPNRIFNIEWRTTYFSGAGTANYELRLYEGQSRFDVIYGTVGQGNTSATAGVQKNDTAFDQYFCNGSGSPSTGGQSYIITPCNQPTVSSAVSRKTHGAAGPFDISLPLTGTPGVEDRTGGATNDYTMVVTFTGNVTVTGSPQAQVTVGAGCVGTGGACMSGNNVTVSGTTVTIPLTNITDDQTINVRLNGVNTADAPEADITIPMSKVVGDSNGNGVANSSDIAQTKGRIGQAVDGTNFRSDVNANGSINSTDVSLIKQQ